MKKNPDQPFWRKYCRHRYHAAERSIAFFLTFDEWRTLWIESGKWEQRGWRRGQYCMARFGDQGAYEIGNVKICLNEENRSERNQNYPLKGEQSPSFGRDRWAEKTPEQQAQWSAAHRVRVSQRGRNPKGQFAHA